MGSFVAAQQFCSTMADFKESVAWILRRAQERGYTFTMTQDEVFVSQVADERYPNQRAPVMVSKSMGMGCYHK